MNKVNELIADLKWQLNFVTDENFDGDYFQETLDKLKQLMYVI